MLSENRRALSLAVPIISGHLGLSQAVCVRVGQARGAGRTERLRPIIFGALGLAVAFMSVFVVVSMMRGKSIAGWFVADPAVVSLTAKLLLVAGIFQIFDGIQVVSSGALRGFEDTRMPMFIGIFSYWIVALPVSWFDGFVLGGGARGVWFGFVVGLAVAAATLLSRVFWKLSGAEPRA
ncbi:MAG: MATE family efflux transporter [Terrimicrobiaceae bacterium]|nr:MATE family efflux transporter [Terrimicrobiaceae bacterium]